MVTLPPTKTNSVDIVKVDGVYLASLYNFSKSVTQQTGINYFTGGSFSGNKITLGSDPGFQPLVVIYQNKTQSYITYQNQLTASTFITSVKLHSFYTANSEIGYSVSYPLNTDGWASQIHIYANLDLNGDGFINSSEKFDISFDYNSQLTNQTNNPLSIGDEGSYTIKNSNINLDLSPEYNYYFEQASHNTTTNFENMVKSLTGKKLYDYKITGIDGLFAFFSGYSYNPMVSSTDPSYKVPFAPGSMFSTFDGNFYNDRSFYNSTIDSLYNFNSIHSMENATNYYLTNFGSNINATKSPDGIYIVENTTLRNNVANISFPTYSYYSAYMYLANEYNFSANPYNQNITTGMYYGTINKNSTTNTYQFSLSPSYYNNNTPINVIIAYYPNTNLFALNGKIVYLGNVSQITSITTYDNYGRQVDLLPRASFNGNIITISNLPGDVPITITHTNEAWNGRTVYAKDYSITSTFPFNTLASVFTPLTPGRTTDFFITENNDKFFNNLAQNVFSPYLQYIGDLLNKELVNKVLFRPLSLNSNLYFSFKTNALNDKTSLMNGSLSMIIPLKAAGQNSFLKIDLYLTLNGSMSFWTTWSDQGILKEFGININIKLSTSPFGQSISTSSSTDIAKTSISSVTTSDGFVIQSVLLIALIALPFVYRRRKNLK